MLEQTVAIVAKQRDHVWVEAQQESACKACSASSGCATSTLGKLSSQKRRPLRVYDRIGVEVGERIVLGTDASNLVGAAFLVYLLPLLTMLLGAMFAGSRGVSDSAVLLISLASLLAGFGVAMLINECLISGQGRIDMLRRAGDLAEKPIVFESNVI